MTIHRQVVQVQVNSAGLAEDEIDVIMSTDALARDGHILVPQGCQLNNYRRNNIWLWSHNPDIPVGNGENVTVSPDGITCRVKFAPRGISPDADMYNGMAKAGVVKAVSIAFDPIDMEPLDPKKPRGGQLIKTWELLEASWVSIPADTGAMVTARQLEDIAGDPPVTETPENTTTKVKKRSRAHAVRTPVKVTFKRGLYQVASLCYLFEEFGWHVDMAKYEAAIEGDASAVPGMLAGILHDLGEALLAMTQEEVAEALAGYDVEVETADEADDSVLLTVDERAHIAAAPTPGVRAFRRGLAHAKLRAGKTLSDETVRCLRDALSQHEDGMADIRSGLAKHKKAVAAVNDLMDRTGVTDEADSETEANAAADPGDDERAAAALRLRQIEIRRRRAA